MSRPGKDWRSGHLRTVRRDDTMPGSALELDDSEGSCSRTLFSNLKFSGTNVLNSISFLMTGSGFTGVSKKRNCFWGKYLLLTTAPDPVSMGVSASSLRYAPLIQGSSGGAALPVVTPPDPLV